MKQIERLPNVIKLRDMTDMAGNAAVQRELALICVTVPEQRRTELLNLVEPCHARIIDIGSTTLTLEVTGHTDALDELLAVLEKKFGIRKLSRSGTLALYRES